MTTCVCLPNIITQYVVITISIKHMESGVCGKGVQANFIQCTVGKKWIHMRCSGVRGDLSG